MGAAHVDAVGCGDSVRWIEWELLLGYCYNVPRIKTRLMSLFSLCLFVVYGGPFAGI